MLPRIKKVEFRNVHIGDDIYTDKDLILHQKGVEAIDASRRLSHEDFSKMLLYEPEIAVFGTGFKQKVAVDQKIIDAARASNVELLALPTAAAARKFIELARAGRKVVAKLHITC